MEQSPETLELRDRVKVLEHVRDELSQIATSKCNEICKLKALLDRAKPQVDPSLSREIDLALGRC